VKRGNEAKVTLTAITICVNLCILFLLIVLPTFCRIKPGKYSIIFWKAMVQATFAVINLVAKRSALFKLWVDQ